MVELEAAAEEVAAAELAELVAAARLRVAAEAEVPEAVAEEGGSARRRRHMRRRGRGSGLGSPLHLWPHDELAHHQLNESTPAKVSQRVRELQRQFSDEPRRCRRVLPLPPPLLLA